MYSDVLDMLEQDPLIGMVSPPLLGASGVVPLTIVSTFVQFPYDYSLTDLGHVASRISCVIIMN